MDDNGQVNFLIYSFLFIIFLSWFFFIRYKNLAFYQQLFENFHNLQFLHTHAIIPALASSYPGSRGSLQGKRNEKREGRASGHIGCKSYFHTWLESEF
jgi:hypothetical protein